MLKNLLWFVLLLRFRAGASWLLLALLTTMGIGFMLLIAYYANMDFPWGLLQHWTDLPWPFG